LTKRQFRTRRETREETPLAQHIAMFQNNSDKGLVAANPKSTHDTYFVAIGKSKKPDYNVLINKGNWKSFDAAFPEANFIYTGRSAYCFWDTGSSQIAGVTAQEPNKVLMISPDAHAGDYRLIVNDDGSIAFAKAT
jgi:hypothetical protein